MENAITLPTIHLNGTGRKSLQEGYDAAAHALDDFIDRWGDIEFNARDYYVSRDPAAWEKARDERDAMGAKIRDIKQYLQTIREHIHS